MLVDYREESCGGVSCRQVKGKNGEWVAMRNTQCKCCSQGAICTSTPDGTTTWRNNDCCSGLSCQGGVCMPE